MALGSEVDDSIKFVLFKQGFDQGAVLDVTFDKCILRCVLDVPQVLQVSGIRQQVQIHNFRFRVILEQRADHVRANEAGTACDENGSKCAFHAFKVKDSSNSSVRFGREAVLLNPQAPLCHLSSVIQNQFRSSHGMVRDSRRESPRRRLP